MRARRHGSAAAHSDHGAGLIEILVAVVLLGLASVGTLTAISAAIRGSSDTYKMSGARRWLVSAADHVVSADVPRVACTSGEPAVRASYQAAGQSITTSRPSGWAAGQLTVVSPVLFWNGTTFTSTCYEGNGLKLQQITIQTLTIDGQLDERLTIVKGDG